MSIRAKLSEFYGFPISRAYLSNVRGSAFKARLVADLIRSKDVTQALDILALSQKRSAKIFEKLLRSALANAINNHGMSAEGLYLFKIVVNEAKTLKRNRPILRRQTAPIRKRGCHFEILLANRQTKKTQPKLELDLEETKAPPEELVKEKVEISQENNQTETSTLQTETSTLTNQSSLEEKQEAKPQDKQSKIDKTDKKTESKAKPKASTTKSKTTKAKTGDK